MFFLIKKINVQLNLYKFMFNVLRTVKIYQLIEILFKILI